MSKKDQFDPFEAEITILNDKLEISQLEGIINRHKTYLNALNQVYSVLEQITVDHYRSCPFNTLLLLKKPIQLFTWVREALYNLIKAMNKDLEFYKELAEKQNETNK
jgi:hypothetical protein